MTDMETRKAGALEAFDDWVSDPHRFTVAHGVLTKAELGLCEAGETLREVLAPDAHSEEDHTEGCSLRCARAPAAQSGEVGAAVVRVWKKLYYEVVEEKNRLKSRILELEEENRVFHNNIITRDAALENERRRITELEAATTDSAEAVAWIIKMLAGNEADRASILTSRYLSDVICAAQRNGGG